MLNWFSKSMRRPKDVLHNQFDVYDLTFLEWEKREVIKHEEKVYVCKEKNGRPEKKRTVYEVIYKREKFAVYSVYRSDELVSAERIYDLVRPVLNSINGGIPTHKPTVVAPLLQAIVETLQNHPKWTLAHIAAKFGLEKLFVKRHADIVANINTQNEPDFMTPLHIAVKSNKLSVTKAVIALNPKPDLTDRRGYSALHYAAMSDRDILIAVLKLPKTRDVLKFRARNGSTALHLACFNDKPDNVIEFMKSGLMTRNLLTIVTPKKVRKSKHKKQEKSSEVVGDDDGVLLTFTSEVIDDLDTEDMKYGGTPLHWVKHRRTMIILIGNKFNVNVHNINGESALHIMVRKFRLKCVITLLCHGADANARDNKGDTPLHYAIDKPDITSAQAITVFDGHIDSENDARETARHIAAKCETDDHHMVIYMLNAIGAKRCDPSMADCNPGCAHDGSYDGKPYSRWPVYDNETFYKQVLLEHVLAGALHDKANQISAGTDGKMSANRSRLICFDGGGVRGLMTIQMLIEMEKQLKYPIINYFDWIAGTSTGSIIAMLLTTGRTVREIRNTYYQFKDKILIGSKPYSSVKFEALLKELVGADMRMADIERVNNKKLIVTATIVDRMPAQLHLFRSFESSAQILGIPDTPPGFIAPPNCAEQRVWEACRASGAAPSYFRAHGPFLDGGIVANNPTLDSLAEFRVYNDSLRSVGRSEESTELELVLSFGTGRFPILPSEVIDVGNLLSINPRDTMKRARYIKTMSQMLITQVTNAEYHVVNRAMAWCGWIRVPYARINPPLSDVIPMDESNDVEIINALWETKAYMYAMRDEVNKLVRILETPIHTAIKRMNGANDDDKNKIIINQNVENTPRSEQSSPVNQALEA